MSQRNKDLVEIVLAAILVIWMFSIVMQGKQNDLTWTVTVKQQKVYDYAGIEFYELHRGDKAALISLDSDLDLARFLHEQDGKKISVSFSAVPSLEK